jgi:hypothetical protein
VRRGGSQPAILVRSSFVALARRLHGPFSDRARPGPEMYPPFMRLPSPRGAALRTELIALFVAQRDVDLNVTFRPRAPDSDSPERLFD